MFRSDLAFEAVCRPAASAHPQSCKDAIVAGEAKRLARICSTKSSLKHHLDFFVETFAARGHDAHRPRALITKALTNVRARARRSCTNKFFLVCKFSSSVRSNAIKAMLHNNSALLKRVFSRPAVSVAYRVQPNLFRLHYQDNWCAKACTKPG